MLKQFSILKVDREGEISTLDSPALSPSRRSASDPSSPILRSPRVSSPSRSYDISDGIHPEATEPTPSGLKGYIKLVLDQNYNRVEILNWITCGIILTFYISLMLSVYEEKIYGFFILAALLLCCLCSAMFAILRFGLTAMDQNRNFRIAQILVNILLVVVVCAMVYLCYKNTKVYYLDYNKLTALGKMDSTKPLKETLDPEILLMLENHNRSVATAISVSYLMFILAITIFLVRIFDFYRKKTFALIFRRENKYTVRGRYTNEYFKKSIDKEASNIVVVSEKDSSPRKAILAHKEDGYDSDDSRAKNVSFNIDIIEKEDKFQNLTSTAEVHSPSTGIEGAECLSTSTPVTLEKRDKTTTFIPQPNNPFIETVIVRERISAPSVPPGIFVDSNTFKSSESTFAKTNKGTETLTTLVSPAATVFHENKSLKILQGSTEEINDPSGESLHKGFSKEINQRSSEISQGLSGEIHESSSKGILLASSGEIPQSSSAENLRSGSSADIEGSSNEKIKSVQVLHQGFSEKIHQISSGEIPQSSSPENLPNCSSADIEVSSNEKSTSVEAPNQGFSGDIHQGSSEECLLASSEDLTPS